VIITHNAAIAAMADRVSSLSDGRLTGEKTNATRAPVSSLEWGRVSPALFPATAAAVNHLDRNFSGTCAM
jgi:hypothetical protein